MVGDAKFYSLVRGEGLPSAKFSVIAEYVWLLEKTQADYRFLVFGNQREVPLLWLSKYGPFVNRVDFYYLDENGNLETLFNSSEGK